MELDKTVEIWFSNLFQSTIFPKYISILWKRSNSYSDLDHITTAKQPVSCVLSFDKVHQQTNKKDSQPARHRQTVRQTDRQTDRQTNSHSWTDTKRHYEHKTRGLFFLPNYPLLWFAICDFSCTRPKVHFWGFQTSDCVRPFRSFSPMIALKQATD